MEIINVRLPHEWTPRPYQRALWDYLKRGGKRAVARYHRRAGKDDIFINHTVCAAHERIGNYWYMLPEYAQARKSMWDAISPATGKRRLDHAIPDIIRARTHQQEMKIELKCGSTIQLVGSDNYNSLVGSPPVGLVFSEYAISNPSAWAYLMPILEENKGWAGFNSTPRGKNHFYQLCLMAENRDGWFYDAKTVIDTGVFDAAQLERIRAELHAQYGEVFGEAMFQQEYMVSFEAAQIGAIWADCVAKADYDGRIGEYPHNPAYPVHCSYDLGHSDSVVIWFFQIIGNQIYVIDFHESNHKSLEFYFVLLRGKTYSYASQWLPHDAYAAHLAAGGKTIAQQFIDASKDGRLGKIKKVPSVSIEHGIQAARATFPLCSFNEVLTEHGLEALRHYHHKYDDERKCFSDKPEHDWSSHCFVGDTKVLTRYGKCQIMNLPKYGEVLTLCGWKQYQNPRITRVSAQLVAVTFKDGITVKCTPDHLFLTDKGWISAENLNQGSEILSSLTKSRSISMAAYIGYGHLINTFQKAAQGFIEMYGKTPLVRYLMDAIFIIKMVIQQTINYPILSACQQVFIYQKHGRMALNQSIHQGNILQRQQDKKQPSGIAQRKAGFGIKEMLKNRKAGQNGNEKIRHVHHAIKNLMLLLEKPGILKFIAHLHAKLRLIERDRRNGRVIIDSVINLNEKADVWCLTVHDAGNFSLSNGAVVHNCADAFRYLSLVWREARKEAPEVPVDQGLINKSIQSIRMGELTKQHFKRMRAASEQ